MKNLSAFIVFLTIVGCVTWNGGIKKDPISIAQFSNVRDIDGNHHIIPNPKMKATVLVFISTQCPVSNKYIPKLNNIYHQLKRDGVELIGVNANPEDTYWDILDHAREFQLDFPLIRDFDQLLMSKLGVRSTSEVVMLDSNRSLIYQGAIDNHFSVGNSKPSANKNYLLNAIDRFLKTGQTSTNTAASGCVISKLAEPKHYTYHRDVKPIVDKFCLGCHREGGGAPFELASYHQVWAMREMIHLMVRENRMPPWGASPKFSQFKNPGFLPEREKRVILDWVRSGAAEGIDPSAEKGDESVATLATYQIQDPDYVFDLHPPDKVDANSGTLFKEYVIDPGFTEDVMVTEVEIQPTAKRSVHHILMFTIPENSTESYSKPLFLPSNGKNVKVYSLPVDSLQFSLFVKYSSPEGQLGHFAAQVPGLYVNKFPEGMGKRIKAGVKLGFNVHYQSWGKNEINTTQVKLKVEKRKKLSEIKVDSLVLKNFVIPEHKRNLLLQAKAVLPQDRVITALFPHAHYRAKSFVMSYQEPGEKRKEFFSVPAFDFFWQQVYSIEPLLLKKGTTLFCDVTYDNSDLNPRNPDPSTAVKYGANAEDEMLLCYYDYYTPGPKQDR